MKIWILGQVDSLTTRYHNSGGMVVIARDEAEARDMVGKHITLTNGSRNSWAAPCQGPTEKEWGKAIVHDISATQPIIYIFPDAGCC